MAITSRSVTVSTSATALDTEADTDIKPGSTTIVVNNVGATSVFLGGSTVTTATGLTLGAGATLVLPWPLAATDRLYGICAAGTNDVRVLETGV